ncbi:shikimate kinase, partial [Acinetobacter sp. 1475718]
MIIQQYKIVFAGSMGAGKTTVGRHLAELLGREFLD